MGADRLQRTCFSGANALAGATKKAPPVGGAFCWRVAARIQLAARAGFRG